MAGPNAVFHKSRADAPRGFFEAEAAGLRWLAAGGARVADVLDVGPGFIDLARVPVSRALPEAATAFGATLARVHDSGAPEFGSPPHGHTGPLYIGEREMGSGTDSRWGRFYVRERVRPFVPLAVERGNLTSVEADLVERACAAVDDGPLDATAGVPARIHGDLWNGNVLWTDEGVVLIDPAAHGGHRETDLAMLGLFGCPYLDRVVAGYQDVHPLADGWRDRVPVHQLHPLAVHAVGHGRAYGAALADAAQQTLALLR
ncbi:fructosamine kinase family protein [Rhodococcus sp. HNM0569]|uniref:fructosamine kinase family protein n=1 Tax=Rhodococcus sp. HNM0569 TaxID=2716340 RepID=UPI00146EE930|nr:fructosamine kinase family protein [Rhodococcus sp. HNM0569]NLU85175.1 phosphotransferase [Rhodococcus sp. HNM0569]